MSTLGYILSARMQARDGKVQTPASEAGAATPRAGVYRIFLLTLNTPLGYNLHRWVAVLSRPFLWQPGMVQRGIDGA